MNLRLASVATLLALPTWPAAEPAPGTDPPAVSFSVFPTGFRKPRPFRNQQNVSVTTNFCLFVMADEGPGGVNRVVRDSVEAEVTPTGGATLALVSGGKPVAPTTGRLEPFASGGRAGYCVYLEPAQPLEHDTEYEVRVQARTADGLDIDPRSCSWRFRTEPDPDRSVALSLDLSAAPTKWQGQHFAGVVKPQFCCSRSAGLIPQYELMAEVTKRYPLAWSLQRDWSPTADYWNHVYFNGNPNVCRERETRRVARITESDQGTVLHVGPFFAHELYGIAADRPLAPDYRVGDVVMVSDKANYERATVVTVNDADRTVTITRLQRKPAEWIIDPPNAIPLRDDPNTPGKFPYAPQCCLRKFQPSGTPVYYWGRVDDEWDIVHRQFGRRLIVDFMSSPVDLSTTGTAGNFPPKDYAEYWQFVRDFTDHLIKRYGRATLDFYYGALNEPDLRPLFWQGTTDELLAFYDYTLDAVLRAFEDNGLDSTKVRVGGLDIGCLGGLPLVKEFLSHCSPRATLEGTPDRNFAFADRRLDGKRSRRVEALCSANGGNGAPCDYLSIHQYKLAGAAAKSLNDAKELALQLDPDYFAKLYVNSHESCPDWQPNPDPDTKRIYLGNGYFSTWCADLFHRRLERAATDPRFAFGETALTIWSRDANLSGINAVTSLIRTEDGKDVPVKHQVFNFLELFASLGQDYLFIPAVQRGGCRIAGFASRRDDALRLLVYAHNEGDYHSRVNPTYAVTLDLASFPWPAAQLTEYRLDREHNAFFSLAEKCRGKKVFSKDEVAELLRLQELAPTRQAAVQAEQGSARLPLEVANNGVTFVELRPK
jgi:hypothetical protein